MTGLGGDINVSEMKKMNKNLNCANVFSSLSHNMKLLSFRDVEKEDVF